MGASAQDLLGKLEPGVEIAAGKVRGLAKELAALVDAGWVTSRKDGRALLVQLTDAGVAHRAALAAAAPPAKVKAKRAAGKPSAAARLEQALAAIAALEARVAALEQAAAPAPALPLREVKAAVLGAVLDLDTRGRLGGVVPIPALRVELRARGVADPAVVDRALEELEREWAIDLSIAQAPTLLTDRGAGIERPGRGLLYYVTRR